MTKYTVGQRIYLKRVGNNARHRKPEDLIVGATITKVGRAYVYAEPDWMPYASVKLHMDDLTHHNGDYTPEWRGYESREAIEDEAEAWRIANELSAKFSFGLAARVLTLDQLRRVKAITEEESCKND